MKQIILSCMILAPFIPYILVLSIGHTYFTNAIRDTTIARMNRIVEDHKHMIDIFLEERKTDLQFVVNSYSFEALIEADNLKIIFNNLQKASNAYVDLGIFDESGLHVAYHGPYALTGKKYNDEEWFIEVLKNGYYISNVFLGFRQVPHFIIAVLNTDGNRNWVIRATIDPYMFNNLVKKVRIGRTGESYIVNADGIFQTEQRSGGERLENDPDFNYYSRYHEGIRAFIAKDSGGETYLYATSWMNDNHWLLVVRQEKADAFSSLRSASYVIVLVSVCGGAVIMVLAFLLTNYIVRRMEATDVEKERLHNQLIQASRLAELGEMAAGFAHEINNPLQIMKNERSLIGVLMEDMKQEKHLHPSEELTEMEESLDQIELQIKRCAAITQAILKFSRQDEPVPVDIDLHRFLTEVIHMVEKRALVTNIKIDQNISKEDLKVHGDPIQLQQVLLNLFNNAIDAIEDCNDVTEGLITIRCVSMPNRRVEISVSDNGCGISQENLDKVFMPFFTTKRVGKGTGLGLSVCYGIVEGMGGIMSVTSKEGSGTTFHINLPAT